MMEGKRTANSPAHCLIEEEYTIAVPLFRPKAALLELLKQIGATHEVLTCKQILDHLKLYIVSKQMFDLYNPNIIHCEGDQLGEVFGVPQFTINEVPNLLMANCIKLPDTHLQRRRRLVPKPSFNANTVPTSSLPTGPQTSSPIVTSTSLLKPSGKNFHPPHSKRRKSSSSSSSGDKIEINEIPSTRNDINSSEDKNDSTESANVGNEKNSDSLEENRDRTNADKSAKNVNEGVTSSENFLCQNASNSGESSATKNMDDKSSMTANASGIDNVKEHLCNETSVHTPDLTTADSHGYRRKRKNSTSSSEASGRKRHQTEPGTRPAAGESSRRRGTSLSILYGDECDKDGYPWYFQLELGDRSDKEESEILSVQDKETVIVQDSTDDLWFLEEDSVAVEVPSDTEFSIEFDVESDNSPPTESDVSSVRSGESFLVVCKESDVEFFADCSDSDSNQGDKELTEADNWVCIECNQSNPPVQRYCGRCWKLRTDWLQSQSEADDKLITDGCKASSPKEIFFTPKEELSASKEKKKDVNKSDSEVNDSGDSTLNDIFIKDLPEQRYSFSNIQLQEKDNKGTHDAEFVNPKVTKAPSIALEDPCIICLTRPKTASLIHGSSGHQVCCFSCGKRLKRRGKLCPVCRRPIQKVVRNYIL